jgi:hypothetical protein
MASKSKAAKLFTHLKRNFAYLNMAFSEVSKSALANQKEMGLQGTQHAVTTRSRAGMSVMQQALADMLEGKQNPGTRLMAEHWWAIHRRAGKLVRTGETDRDGNPILREETEEERLTRWETESGGYSRDFGPVILTQEVKTQEDNRGTIKSGRAEWVRKVEDDSDLPPLLDENGMPVEIYSDGTWQDEDEVSYHVNLYVENAAQASLLPVASVSRVFVRAVSHETAQQDLRRLVELHYYGAASEDPNLQLLLDGTFPLLPLGRISLVVETDHGMELVSYDTNKRLGKLVRDPETGWVIFQIEAKEELVRSVEHT